MINYEQKSEQGITLLLAVTLMSGLMLIATTVATLSVDQIRASRAQLVTEPAFLAAKVGSEEGLWLIKRTGLSSLPDCASSFIDDSLYNSNSYIYYCKSYNGQTFDLTGGVDTQILLYDPNDPNGNIDLLSYPYTVATLSYGSGGFTTQMNAVRLDGSTTGLGAGCSVSTVIPSCDINISPVGAGTEGRIILTLTSTGDTTVGVDTNRGLPENLNIDTTACSSRNSTPTSCSSSNEEIYTRKIKVRLGN